MLLLMNEGYLNGSNIGYQGWIIDLLTKREFKHGKTSLKQPLKIDKTKILMTNGRLMHVKIIAECSPWSILQYF